MRKVKIGFRLVTPEGGVEILVRRINDENNRADIWQVEGKDGRPLFVTKIYWSGEEESEELCPDFRTLTRSITRAEKHLNGGKAHD